MAEQQYQYFAGKEFAEKMGKGELSYPETYRPEDRDRDYMMRMCQYVYGAYSYGYTYIRNGGYGSYGRSISELRSYARGEQSVEKYKKVLDFRSDKGERRELDNISWENTKVMNKFRTQALSRISSFKYQPGVRAVDDLSNEKRRNAYYRDKLAATPAFKQAMGQTGIVPEGVNPMAVNMSPVDIDTFNMLGGYTLAGEILLTDAIQAGFEMSGWDYIKERIDEDVFDLGFCSAMVDRKPGDNKYFVRYVDPHGVIVPSSAFNDFRDSQYRAVVERRTIAQLRMESEISEEELLGAAKMYSAYLRNPKWSSEFESNRGNSSRQSFSALRTSRYDEFSCDVMTVYFVALDVEKYVCGRHENGNDLFARVKSDSKLTERHIKQGKTLETVPVQYLYKASWIIGTNTIFNYGKDDTIVREGSKGSKEVVFPLIVYALNEPSIVERCIPTIDDIEIAVRKKRLSLATMPPGPGYMIDMSLMEDSVNLGAQSYSVRDLLGIYFNTGMLYYQSRGEFQSNMDAGSNRAPIMPMQSSKLQELQAFITEIQSLINDLSFTIGSNSVVEGSVDPANLLNGVASQMQSAANSALYTNISAGKDVYLAVEKIFGMKYQTGVLYGDIKISYIPGTRAMPKTIELTPAILDSEFYFTLEAMPSAEDKQLLMGMLQKLSVERRLSEDVFFAVSNMIQEGDVKKAQWLMAIEAAKADERQQAQQMQAIQAQAQANMQSAQASEQARAQAEGVIIKGKMEVAKLESELRIGEENNKHKNRLKEIVVEKNQQAQIDATMATMAPAPTPVSAMPPTPAVAPIPPQQTIGLM